MERRAAPGKGWRRHHRRPPALLLLALAAAPGCRPAPRAPAQAGAPQAHRYTVRGEVVRLPAPERRDPELYVRHEAIEGFVDREGKAVGMAAMVMPFRLEPPDLARGLAVGDKVEIGFAVDWSGPTFRVERVARLPPETPLRFGPARQRERAR